MGVKYGKILPSDHYKIWRFIQTSYSYRSLKKNDDLYRALGAVAEAIQIASTGQYLAGLWRDDIIDGLVWCSEFHDPAFSQPDFCEGEDVNQIPPSPSWSWLSRLRPISCYGALRDKVDPATLVSWSLDFADDNSPFGHIRGGSLKILATTVQSKDVPREVTSVRNQVLLQCRLDVQSSSDSLYETDCSAFVGDQYLYLRVGFSINPDSKQSRWLLLESIKGGVYVRRGLIFMKEDENEVPGWQKKYGKRMTIDIV